MAANYLPIILMAISSKVPLAALPYTPRKLRQRKRLPLLLFFVYVERRPIDAYALITHLY